MDRSMERILPRVQKPARYTGGEYNAVVKDRDRVDTRVALCFPDTYEIGMSNLGIRILYGLMNELDGVWCERVFAPWGDMEEQMRSEGIPLYALESGDSIADFDIIGFSLGYELAYTNVLNLLDLAGLPLRAQERKGLSPLIIAGGTCAYHPEPLAPFIDIFSLGEGEEVLPELIALYRKAREEEWSKGELLLEAARIPGLYVPSLYDVTYHENGTVAGITPRRGAPELVTKRIVQDLDHSYFPVKTIVPSTEIVHDRVMLEVFRGCIRGCRFCQAGYAYRPVRSKSPELLRQQGIAACKDSGYQEVTLSSLSTSDYQPLMELCDGLLEWCEPNKVSLSLPSLRADSFSMSLTQRLQHVRKSGLTFAPEAGTQRLRDAINKNVTEEDLLTSCRTAFSGGWNSVKLYFMLGLPTETDEDVLGIADLAQKVYGIWKESSPNRSRGVRITVSTAFFVPKPHTPFQWVAMDSEENIKHKQNILKNSLQRKDVNPAWQDYPRSLLEAVISRGDRRLGRVIYRAWQMGAYFDGWGEHFKFDIWDKAFREQGIDPYFYTQRELQPDEPLPWGHIDTGVSVEFLKREYKRALDEEETPDCRNHPCNACGTEKVNNLCIYKKS